MRNFTSFTVAALLATAMLAGPVLANQKGHHSKQSEPNYWLQDEMPSQSKAPAAYDQVTKETKSNTAANRLIEGGYRRDRVDQPVTANGDVR